MYATDVIKPFIDQEYILNYYKFKNINRHGKYIRACCKIHDGNNPTGFVYNTENDLWYCHTGDCGGGDAYELISKLENCSFPEAIIKASEIFNVDINELELTHIKTDNEKEREEWLKLMKEKVYELKEFNFSSSELKPIKKFRHFKQETLEYFGAEYVDEIIVYNSDNEPYTLRNRIVIPIYFNDVKVGVSLRRVKNNDIQKWSHQGFESRYFLYNIDNCIKYITENNIDEIMIVEGIFDVWNCYEQGIYNVVATFGAHLTDEQENMLLRLCTTIITAYDGDETGIINTLKVIERTKYKFDVYCIEFKVDEDPGSCMNMQERYNNKIFYTKFGGSINERSKNRVI
jgi:DNA primase